MRNQPAVIGTAELLPLARFKPNGWNPNVLTPFEMEALEKGFEQDGWVASQPLLVWGKDKRGKVKDLVIDGEHRLTVALKRGYKEGPVVVLDGLTEGQAKALTIKLDAKRGSFNEEALAKLLQDIQQVSQDGLDALELGIEEGELARLLVLGQQVEELVGAIGQAVPPLPAGIAPTIQSTNAHIKMVPLYFDGPRHERFVAAIKKLSAAYKLDTVTDVVERCILEGSAS